MVSNQENFNSNLELAVSHDKKSIYLKCNIKKNIIIIDLLQRGTQQP